MTEQRPRGAWGAHHPPGQPQAAAPVWTGTGAASRVPPGEVATPATGSCVPQVGADSHRGSQNQARQVGQVPPYSPSPSHCMHLTTLRVTRDQVGPHPSCQAPVPPAPYPMRGGGRSAGPTGQRVEHGPPSLTCPPSPTSSSKISNQHSNQENKGIRAHFNRRGPSQPLIHQLLESEFYKQFL